jgi:carboxypeptidase T
LGLTPCSFAAGAHLVTDTGTRYVRPVTKRLIVVALVALAGLIPTAVPSAGTQADGPQIKRYDLYGVSTREQRSLLVSQGYDIGEAAWADHVELFGTQEQAQALALRGYQVVPKAGTDDFPPPDSKYHNYAEMVADVQAVAAAHPATVHLFSLGTSYEGRDLIGARVSNDASDNLNEPGVFFVGQHHAREHLTVEVVLSLLHLFAESTDKKVQKLVKSRQIYIVPSLNPDGSEYDIATGQYRYWRKNRQPTPQQGVYGTDQNRNYSYKWGCCGGSSGDPSSEVYRGPFALSTPEDTRLAEFVIAHKNVTTGISYHSYGNLLMYPYGYTYTDVPPDMLPIDHQAFVKISGKMSNLTGYHAEQSSDLYITDGDWNDWMYGAEHRYPFTIELSGNGFYPPDEFIPGESQRNQSAAVYLAKIANCPTKVVGQRCR